MSWILDSTPWISGLQALNSGFYASGAWIPDSKAQDSEHKEGFPGFQNLDSLHQMETRGGTVLVSVSLAFKISDIVV